MFTHNYTVYKISTRACCSILGFDITGWGTPSSVHQRRFGSSQIQLPTANCNGTKAYQGRSGFKDAKSHPCSRSLNFYHWENKLLHPYGLFWIYHHHNLCIYQQGDTVYLIRKVDSNWVEGRVGHEQGIFPASYVDIVTEPDTPLMTPMSSYAPTPATGRSFSSRLE